VPYGWIARTTPPGLFRIGDQAACIPSLAGEGIGVALASAERAASAWAEHGDARAYQRSMAATVQLPVRMAALARTLATASPALSAMMPYVMRTPGLATLLARLTRI